MPAYTVGAERKKDQYPRAASRSDRSAKSLRYTVRCARPVAAGFKAAKMEGQMMTASSTEGRPIGAWLQVLEQIEGALARRLAQVEEPNAPEAETGPKAKTPLQILEERLAQMRTRLDRAEREAAEVDAALNTEAEAYQRWTESMTAARRRLADWAGRVA
jgi:hypothetical protein